MGVAQEEENSKLESTAKWQHRGTKHPQSFIGMPFLPVDPTSHHLSQHRKRQPNGLGPLGCRKGITRSFCFSNMVTVIIRKRKMALVPTNLTCAWQNISWTSGGTLVQGNGYVWGWFSLSSDVCLGRSSHWTARAEMSTSSTLAKIHGEVSIRDKADPNAVWVSSRVLGLNSAVSIFSKHVNVVFVSV